MSFGWLNYHLYNFVDAKGAGHESDADAMDLPLDKGRKMLLAAEVAIGKVLKKVAAEIHARVWHLHELVCTALPAK